LDPRFREKSENIWVSAFNAEFRDEGSGFITCSEIL
jgi:hypothetical protein